MSERQQADGQQAGLSSDVVALENVVGLEGLERHIIGGAEFDNRIDDLVRVQLVAQHPGSGPGRQLQLNVSTIGTELVVNPSTMASLNPVAYGPGLSLTTSMP